IKPVRAVTMVASLRGWLGAACGGSAGVLADPVPFSPPFRRAATAPWTSPVLYSRGHAFRGTPMNDKLLGVLGALPLVIACGRPADASDEVPQPRPAGTVPALEASDCGGGTMTVRFYDVGEALAALVALPDGRHILVDTGDGARRTGCGAICQ